MTENKGDYISREAAIDEATQEGAYGYISAEELEKLPAADVRPVVHGKWILHEDGSATCSNCKTRQKLIYDDDSWQHYCGNCGAQMEVER